MLGGLKGDIPVRKKALEQLGRVATKSMDEVMAPVIKALNEEHDPAYRENPARGDRQACDTLIARLQEKADNVRKVAAKASDKLHKKVIDKLAMP